MDELHMKTESAEHRTTILPDDIQAEIEDRFSDLMLQVGASISDLRSSAYEVAERAYLRGQEMQEGDKDV